VIGVQATVAKNGAKGTFRYLKDMKLRLSYAIRRGGFMKLRIVIASLVAVVMLAVLAVVGIARGQGLSDKVYQAYSTDSIDSYLGTTIAVEPESCQSLENSVKQRLASSQAPKNLADILERLNKTLNNGQITKASFAWFLDEDFTTEIDYPTDSYALPGVIRGALEFDPALIKAEGVEEFSKRDLDERLKELRSKGQLPSRVSVDNWYQPFTEKYLEACSPSLDPMIETVVGSFDTNVSELSSKVLSILRDDWTSEGFEKIGHLVAYNPNNPSNCSGFSGCAIFWVETATPCEVKVTVEFTNSSNKVVDVGSSTRFIAQANTRTTMQVSSIYADGNGFYQVTEAKCK